MNTFAGKVVLVTGSTSGIGRTTAITFAQQGATVITTGLSENDGQETVRLIQETGSEGLFLKADLTQANEVKQLVNTAIEKYGRIDCAFNNAAIEGTLEPFIELPKAEFDKVIATNLKSVWLCMKYEIQQMRCGRVEARSSTLPQWQEWLGFQTWLPTLQPSTAFWD